MTKTVRKTTYQITQVPVAPCDDTGSGAATDYVVHWWPGQPDKEPFGKVRLYSDLNVKVFFSGDHVQAAASYWMYGDQAGGVYEALTQAMKERTKRAHRRPTQRELNKMIGKLKSTLTLSRSQARRFIKSAEWRKRDGGGVEVKYEGKWLHLCRTDLKDDVRTWTSWASDSDAHHMDHYRRTVHYGARITDHSFYIVDAVSDG